MATMKKAKEDTTCTFLKEQLVNSKKYRKYQDFLQGNLDDDKSYSFNEVDKMIEDFYGRSDA